MKQKSNEFGEAIWSLGVLVLLGFLAFSFTLLQFALIYCLLHSLHSFFLRLHMAWLVVSCPLTSFNIIS